MIFWVILFLLSFWLFAQFRCCLLSPQLLKKCLVSFILSSPPPPPLTYISIPHRIIALDSFWYILPPPDHRACDNVFLFDLFNRVQVQHSRQSLPKSRPNLYSCVSVHSSHISFAQGLDHQFHQYFVILFILFFSWY